MKKSPTAFSLSVPFWCFRAGVFTSDFASALASTFASAFASVLASFSFSFPFFLATIDSDGPGSIFSRVGDSVKYGEPGGEGDAGSDGFRFPEGLTLAWFGSWTVPNSFSSVEDTNLSSVS
jgi:hypothetical protein